MDQLKKRIGGDLSKWYITGQGKRWTVCPPIRRDDDGEPIPGWWEAGATFATGVEALAAFAAGGPA